MSLQHLIYVSVLNMYIKSKLLQHIPAVGSCSGQGQSCRPGQQQSVWGGGGGEEKNMILPTTFMLKEHYLLVE